MLFDVPQKFSSSFACATRWTRLETPAVGHSSEPQHSVQTSISRCGPHTATAVRSRKSGCQKPGSKEGLKGSVVVRAVGFYLVLLSKNRAT